MIEMIFFFVDKDLNMRTNWRIKFIYASVYIHLTYLRKPSLVRLNHRFFTRHCQWWSQRARYHFHFCTESLSKRLIIWWYNLILYCIFFKYISCTCTGKSPDQGVFISIFNQPHYLMLLIGFLLFLKFILRGAKSDFLFFHFRMLV